MAEKDDETGKPEKGTIEVEDGTEVTTRTIVGGRPRKPRKVRINVPAGLEKLMYKAAIDAGFRRRLLEDRAAAVAASRIALTPIEARMLEAIPPERLAASIDRIEPLRHGKRRFMRTVATAVVTLATGTAAITVEGGCQSAGVDPHIFDTSSEDMPADDSTPVDLVVDDWMPADGDEPDVPDEDDVTDDPEDEDAADGKDDGEDAPEDNGDAA